jgi:hypothetical protein
MSGKEEINAFIPRPDVRERHEITIPAPAAIVFEAACHFDLQSIRLARAIFWLRAKILGAEMQPTKRSEGLVADMLQMGWGRLAEEANHFFVAGAVCQPWQADVIFSPVPPDQFASFAEPDQVKIAWTLETEALGPASTRFATETRAVATDDQAAVKFQRYWRRFGIGAILIRRLVLNALYRQVKRRCRKVHRSRRDNEQST